jgi:hypothetical protein
LNCYLDPKAALAREALFFFLCYSIGTSSNLFDFLKVVRTRISQVNKVKSKINKMQDATNGKIKIESNCIHRI